MKKLYFFLLSMIILSGAACAQTSCFAQLLANSSGNLCNGNCNGIIQCFPGGGSPPYTFSWSNGATTQNISGLCAGTYTVVVTTATSTTCSNSATITQPTLLSISTSSTINSATASPSGGTPGYTYLWMPSGQTTSTATALTSGTYNITVTDANGCSVNGTVLVSTTGFAYLQNEQIFNILLSPNPVQNIITVEAEIRNQSSVTISFTDISGNVICSEVILTDKYLSESYDISRMASGLYFVSLKTENTIVVQKFVKE